MLEWKEIPLKFYFMHYMYEIERYLFYGSLSWESNQYFYQFAECLNIENMHGYFISNIEVYAQ